MTIADDMAAMADDPMATLGVPATYRAGGAGDGVAAKKRAALAAGRALVAAGW